MYKLEIAPKVTRELLLSKNSQETYFEHYLGVPVKKGLFRSPSVIRSDANPTCSFYKNKNNILMYKDFAGPTFDFIGCVMYLFNCNYYNALRIIAHDFNIIPIADIPRNPPKIQYTNTVLEKTSKSRIEVELKEFSEKELKSVLKSYKLKKKYHRLKDGTFVNLESNGFESLENIIDEKSVLIDKINLLLLRNKNYNYILNI